MTRMLFRLAAVLIGISPLVVVEVVCRANGWEASNTGRGNSNHACARVMTYWSAGGVSTGTGSWNSGRYTPNRAPGSHIYMTCIGGQ